MPRTSRSLLAFALESTILARLASLETRKQAATELAQELGADDLLLFLRDPEVGVLLPAPGFQQTFPSGKEWQALLTRSNAEREASARLRLRADANEQPVIGVGCDSNVTMVLIGGNPNREAARALAPLMVLVGLAIRGEQAATIAAAGARLSAEAAATSGRLTDALDRARRNAERSSAEASRANRAKSDFLATMSHELRTPLNAIGGYADLMLMELPGPITPEQRDQLTRMRASQRHLLGLINSVLNMTQIENGRIEYRLQRVPILALVDEVLGLIEPQARAKGVMLSTSDCVTELNTRADPDRLRQIILNLLANAVKFTPAGGSIRIRCTSLNDEVVVISVSDTGIGIADEELLRIFDPFVQVGRRYASGDEGVGLGLAISRDLARGMNGDLTAESKLGKGSTFTVRLPRAD